MNTEKRKHGSEYGVPANDLERIKRTEEANVLESLVAELLEAKSDNEASAALGRIRSYVEQKKEE